MCPRQGTDTAGLGYILAQTRFGSVSSVSHGRTDTEVCCTGLEHGNDTELTRLQYNSSSVRSERSSYALSAPLGFQNHHHIGCRHNQNGCFSVVPTGYDPQENFWDVASSFFGSVQFLQYTVCYI